MPPSEPGSRLVYSTDGGRVKPAPLTPHNRKVEPSKPVAASRAAIPPDDGVVRVQRDKKGRGGKTATTVTGLPGTDAELDACLKQLKQFCGAGGSREGRTLILQGDQRDRLMERLAAMGHRPKLAGG